MATPTALYIVPTPIGNLKDITYRAVETLQSVDTILAEDTRTSGKLLKHYEIKKPLLSHHAFNEHKTSESIVKRLKSGETMALISDAGTPTISDPGYTLIKACLENGIKIECLPGATAFVPALVKSGFASDNFIFGGFIPHKKGRQTKLKQMAEEPRTSIVYESTHRIIKTLEQLKEILEEDRLISVSRELTKIYEETMIGTPSELLEYYQEHSTKGEFVLVVSGKK